MRKAIAPSDEKLVEKSLAGDDSAFEELLGKYLSPVFNFLFRISGNRDDASDLIQETFVKAWKNLHKFDSQKSHKSRFENKSGNLAPYRTKSSGSGFKTWLFTIAKNTAFDWLKKKKEIPFASFINDEGENKFPEIADANSLPDEILERKDAAKILEEKLEKIPAYYRTVLLLHYREDFSLAEISQILGEPYSTVKSRHLRALKRLKQAILE